MIHIFIYVPRAKKANVVVDPFVVVEGRYRVTLNDVVPLIAVILEITTSADED